MADYDLNAIADAMAAQLNGMSTDVYDGRSLTVTAFAEGPDNLTPPAIVLELDDLDYDLSAGRGADRFVFLAFLIVAGADSASGQRLVRRMLSSGGLAHSVKDRLEEDPTLGGLVSYAHMSGTRTIGTITYAGLDYQGATLEIEVMT